MKIKLREIWQKPKAPFIAQFTIFLAITLLLSACSDGGGGDSGGAPPDTTPPEILSTTPADGGYLLPAETISLQFSMVMDTTVGTLSGTMLETGSNWNWTASGDTISVTPPGMGWSEATNRSLNLTGFANTSGIALADTTLTYSVDITAPTGTENPASGVYTYNICIDFKPFNSYYVTFSEPMDPSTLTSSTAQDLKTVVWNSTQTSVTFNNTLSTTLNASDMAGNAITPLSISYSFPHDGSVCP